ncbi:hypothetical protein GCM10025786_34360 [Nocardioides caeni]
MHRRLLSCLLGLVTLTVVMALVAACSDSSEELPDVPSLAAAWEVDGGDISFGDTYWSKPAVWSTDDSLIVLSSDLRGARTMLRGLDRANGTTRWSAVVPGGWCTSSDEVGPDGTVAIRLRSSGTALSCDRLVAIDSTTGEVRWSVDLAIPGDRLDQPRVSVGEVVITSGNCGQVLRFDLGDGSALPASTGLRESRDAILDQCGKGGFGDGVMTRRTARGTALLTDSGTPIWQTRRAIQTADIVSADPLVLEVEEGGSRLLRRYDEGRPGPAIGYELGYTRGFRPIAHDEHTLVGTYDDAEIIEAFDLDTGELLWARDSDRFTSGRRLLGVHDSQLVWGQGVNSLEEEENYPHDDMWVSVSSLRDPDAGRTLGAVRRSSYLSTSDLWTVSGGLLITGGSRLTAWSLDEVPEDAPDEILTVPRSHLAGPDSDVPWSDAEVSDGAAIRACTRVSDESLRLLGLDPEAPAPADCSWRSGGAQETSLRIELSLTEPTADRSGADVAAERLSDLGDQFDTRPVHGLGQEALAWGGPATASWTFVSSPAQGGLTSSYGLIVRQDNIVLEASADVTSTRTGAPAAAPSDVRAGVVSAVRDVLAELGRPTDAPAAGEPGTLEATGPVCRRVAAVAARVLPPADARLTSGDGAAAACVWVDEPRELQVAVEAVGAAPVGGSSGLEEATVMVESSAGDPHPGVGDDARLARPDGDTTQLVARRDNLVVTVSYVDSWWSDDQLSDEAELRLVERVARAALRG